MQEAASTRCAVAAARFDRIQVALNAVGQGVFLRSDVRAMSLLSTATRSTYLAATGARNAGS